MEVPLFIPHMKPTGSVWATPDTDKRAGAVVPLALLPQALNEFHVLNIFQETLIKAIRSRLGDKTARKIGDLQLKLLSGSVTRTNAIRHYVHSPSQGSVKYPRLCASSVPGSYHGL